VVDPLGGINSLWPLFGISNQLLAGVALCVGTTVLIKMGKVRYIWVMAIPMIWLMSVTFTAAYQKVFAADPRLGFLAHARSIEATLATGQLPAGATTIEAANRMIFNDRLDAGLAIFFLAVVILVLIASAREWYLILSGRKEAVLHEAPAVPTGAMPAR
jgi:carbon starvation protein